MKCSEIRELLSLYIDNMLEESLIDEVAAHVQLLVLNAKASTKSL